MPNNQQHHSDRDLNTYLKSPRPANWLILILTLMLLAMVLIWSFLGNMKTTIAITGVNDGGHFVGYLQPKYSLSLEQGMDMDYNGQTVGMLTGRGMTALTAEEIAVQIDNDYLLSQLPLNPYNLMITADLDPNLCPEGVITLEIVVGETRPFDYLMN